MSETDFMQSCVAEAKERGVPVRLIFAERFEAGDPAAVAAAEALGTTPTAPSPVQSTDVPPAETEVSDVAVESDEEEDETDYGSI